MEDYPENLRRMQKYDNEICPEQWRPTIDFVKKNGFDWLEIIKRFGIRDMYDKEGLTHSAIALKHLNMAGTKMHFEKNAYDINVLGSCMSDKEEKSLIAGQVRIDDSITGFRYLFINPRRDISHEGVKFHLADLRGKIEGIDKTKRNLDTHDKWVGYPITGAFLEVGEISLSGLEKVVKERFGYIFNRVPRTNREFIKHFLEKNCHNLQEFELLVNEYCLELERIPDNKQGKKNQEILCKSKGSGVFKEVGFYTLIGGENHKCPPLPPWLLGFDHFDNIYEIDYLGAKQPTEK